MSFERIRQSRPGQTVYDLAGIRFGNWRVLRRGERKHYWLCRCDCGTEREVRQQGLTDNKSTGCGCFARQRNTVSGITHGYSKTPTYITWVKMRGRCLNPADDNYDRYGARGIGVCRRWVDSFESFLEDMGERPEGLTLDRIDNDGNYSPENCRWASMAVQCRNRSRNHWIEFRGVRKTITDWAESIGISPNTLHKRLQVGWTVEDALTTPALPRSERRGNKWRRLTRQG